MSNTKPHSSKVSEAVMETAYRIYPNGEIVHQDEFSECSDQYDDYEQVTEVDGSEQHPDIIKYLGEM